MLKTIQYWPELIGGFFAQTGLALEPEPAASMPLLQARAMATRSTNAARVWRASACWRTVRAGDGEPGRGQFGELALGGRPRMARSRRAAVGSPALARIMADGLPRRAAAWLGGDQGRQRPHTADLRCAHW